MKLFGRKLVSRELEPVLGDTSTWIRTYSRVLVRTRRGDGVSYRGPVLKPQAGTGSPLQFSCKTTALRRARVRIPICVNAETVVTVFVDGHLARRATLRPAAAGSFTLRPLAQDVTRWTEAREGALLQLQFSSDNQSDSPFILLSDDQPRCRPLLLQPGGDRYMWTSALYFLLVWANLLTLSVVALAKLQIEQEALRIYAVLGTCLVWLAGLLGLPDLARIPVRAWIRRIFAATRSVGGGLVGRHRREFGIVALVGVMAASGVAFTEVVGCYWVRHQYKRLIDEALASDDITPAKAALKLVPWRREAQILVEKAASRARGASDPELFRHVAADLAKDPGVYAAIEQAARSTRPPSYLEVKSPGVGNPVAWYASMILEGESDGETELVDKAKSLLRVHAEPESRLLLDTLEFAYFPPTGDGDVQERLVTDLEARLLKDPPDLFTHTYLFASDSLFTYHLQGCENLLALTWLEDELRNRARALEYDQTLWLRPPEKFVAYQLFGVYGRSKDGVINPESPGASKVRRLVEPCAGFLTEFNRIEDRFEIFGTRKGWVRKTVFAEDLKLGEVVNSLLTQGWRY